MAAYPEKLLEDYTNIENAFRTNDGPWSDKVLEISQQQIRPILEEGKDDSGIFQIKAIQERFTDYKSEDFTRLEGKDAQGKKISGARTYAFIYTIATSLAEYGATIEDGSVKLEIFALVSTLYEAFHLPVWANKDKLLSIFIGEDSNVFTRLTALINRLIADEKGAYLDSRLDKLLTTIFLCVRCIDFGIYATRGSSFIYTQNGPRGKILASLAVIENCHRDFLEAKTKSESIEDKEKDEEAQDSKEKKVVSAVPKDRALGLEVILREVSEQGFPQGILNLEAMTNRDAIIADKKIYEDLYAEIEAQEEIQDKIDTFFTYITDRADFIGLLQNLELTENEMSSYIVTYNSYHSTSIIDIGWHFVSGVSLDEDTFYDLFEKIYNKKKLTEEEKDNVNRYDQLKGIRGKSIGFFSDMITLVEKIKEIETIVNHEETFLEDRVLGISELLGLLRFFTNRDVAMFKEQLVVFPSLIKEIEKIEQQVGFFVESLENKQEILNIGIVLKNLKEGGLLEPSYNECVKKIQAMYQNLLEEYDFSKDNGNKMALFKNNVTAVIDEAIFQCVGKSSKPLHYLKNQFKGIYTHIDSSKSVSFTLGQSAFFQQENVSDALSEQTNLLEKEITRRKELADKFFSGLSARSGLRLTYNDCVEILKKEHEKFVEKYEKTLLPRIKKTLLLTFEERVREIIDDKIACCETALSRGPLLELREDFCQLYSSNQLSYRRLGASYKG